MLSSAIMDFFNAWGNTASVLSFVISVLAAVVAFCARSAAHRANEKLRKSVVIHNLALAISAFGQIQDLVRHRDTASQVLLGERCAVVEQALLEIQGVKIPEAEEHRIAIMTVIRQVQIIKEQMTSRLRGNKRTIDWEQFNLVAGREAGKLVQLKSALLYAL